MLYVVNYVKHLNYNPVLIKNFSIIHYRSLQKKKNLVYRDFFLLGYSFFGLSKPRDFT